MYTHEKFSHNLTLKVFPKKGHAAIVEILLKAGADVDKAMNDGGTALMWASQNGHAAIVEASF